MSDLITDLQAQLQSVVQRLEALRSTPPVAVRQPASVSVEAAAQTGSDHQGLAAEGAFYDWLRDNDMLGPKISPAEFKGCDAITRACAEPGWPVSWTAYALATAYLETAHQMLPVREAYWLSDAAAAAYYRRMYDPQGARPEVAARLGNKYAGDGALFCGRGYIQLTGRANYARAAENLGVDLVGHPEMALDPGIAAAIMVKGMSQGWFTGAKLADFLPEIGEASADDFTPARRTINGLDHAGDVAGFAVNFQRALAAGKWRFTQGGAI